MIEDFPTRLVTGIQPTQQLHLGQYFGAIAPALQLHDNFAGDCFYFIADYHSLTRGWVGGKSRSGSEHVARGCLALGLDPERARLYRQSDVPQTCELMWLLSCVTGKGQLERAVVYKSMREEGVPPTVGLFMYPELQAADILGLRGTWVPAGRNQTQSIEIARAIARRANNELGRHVFPEPEVVESHSPKVLGTDGITEMNYSRGNFIPIFGEEQLVREAIRSIRTAPVAKGASIDPTNDLILHYLRLLDTDDMRTTTRAAVEYVELGYAEGAVGYGEAKAILGDAFLEFFKPTRDYYFSSDCSRSMIEEILCFGAASARREFEATLEIVRDIVGLGPYTREEGM